MVQKLSLLGLLDLTGKASKCGKVSGPMGALESGGGEGGGGDAKQYGVM